MSDHPYKERYEKSKKAEIMNLASRACEKLGIKENCWDTILETRDIFWEAMPGKTKLRGPAIMAEVLIFHSMRCNGLPINPEEFTHHAPVPGVPMRKRPWLLAYKDHLPREMIARTAGNPGIYLENIMTDQAYSNGFKRDARAILNWLGEITGGFHPRVHAACAAFLAYKLHDLRHPSLCSTLERCGVLHPATVHNAVHRLLARQGMNLEHLLSGFRMSKDPTRIRIPITVES
ncbi:hypothetical protein GF325_00220 [Candidatus Bathyarchaeota archaeon]|nr:hypothetical protein [Candidatus Bathyarchaeota archaeon]